MTHKETYERFKTLRGQGKKYQEIAEALGKSYETVKSYCIKHDLKYTKEERKESNKTKFEPKDASYWKQKIKKHYGSNFELVSVGTLDENTERQITIRCVKCGTLKTVLSAALRKDHKGNCLQCLAKTRKEKKTDEALVIISEKYKKDVKEAKNRCNFEQIQFKYCSCGNITQNNRLLCSSCRSINEKKRKRKHYKKKDLRRRKALTGGDFTILLEDLYERDNGVCWLCGKNCDWSDYEIVDETFVAGNQYPSIDHVIPLAKGGTHTWDNVKLAHRICNSIKSDKLSPGLVKV